MACDQSYLHSWVRHWNVGCRIKQDRQFDVFLIMHHSIDFFQITNLMHNSFILQQYVCYTTILNMFRAARCSSSGGQIVSPPSLVSSPSVNSCTVCHLHSVRLFTEGDDTRDGGDTICPPEDEQRAARNMLRIVV